MVNMIETYRIFPDEILYLDGDNIHPNPLGHRLIAQQILNTMEENNIIPLGEDSF